jgi:neutral ceramidase
MGNYDITGPAADVSMMGYASAEKIATGSTSGLQD